MRMLVATFFLSLVAGAGCESFSAGSGGASAVTNGSTGSTESTNGASGTESTNAASSGSECSCPSTDHATGSCVNGACTYTCASNWGDCDSDPSTCEMDLTDSMHCGACSTVCAVEGCVQINGAPACNDPVAITAGDNHTCVLRADGSVWCWGANNVGQIGSGSATFTQPKPYRVTLPNFATKVSARGSSTCALLADHTVACWGQNGTSATTPKVVTGISSASDLSTAGTFNSSTVGDSYVIIPPSGLSQFIVDSINQPPVATVVSSGASGIVAGGAHGCYFNATQQTVCFGNNVHAQVGDYGGSSSPNHPAYVLPQLTAKALAAGEDFSCAITSGNDVVCWGGDVHGQAAVSDAGSPNTSLHSVDLGGTKAQSIFAGHHHAGVLSTAGALYLWGYNSDHQTSPADVADHFAPTIYSGLTDIDSVALGWLHSCVLLKNHQVECWGAGSSGQIGDGLGTSTPTPTSPVWTDQ